MPSSDFSPVDHNDTNSDDGISLWSTLLNEVANKNSIKLPSSRVLIVLGDEDSGKSTLIARLQGEEEPNRGYGLEYTMIDIKDEERDDQTKLNVWIMDGDTALSHLLKFPLSANNFGECLVMIIVSVSKPWTIMESLEKWTNILEDHITRLPMDKNIYREYKNGLLRQFRDYQEPMTISEAVDGTQATDPPPSTASKSHLFRRPTLVSSSGTAVPLLSLRPGPPPLRTSIENISEANEDGATDSDGDEEATPGASPTTTTGIANSPECPLDPSTLCANLGIPVIVVVTKSDKMNQLEQAEGYTEETFDFLQMHIRRFCLKYGAALFYVSLKEDKNINLLKRYLMSRMYGFTFIHPANVVERDSVLVPSGWDSEKKIDILAENFANISKDTPFGQVITPLNPTKPSAGRDHEVTLPDEQAFLSRLAAMELRETSSSSDGANILSVSPDRPLDKQGVPMEGYKSGQTISTGPSNTGPQPANIGRRSGNILKGILMGLVQKHAKSIGEDKPSEKSTNQPIPKSFDDSTTKDTKDPPPIGRTVEPSPIKDEKTSAKAKLKRKLMQRQGKPTKDHIITEKMETTEAINDVASTSVDGSHPPLDQSNNDTITDLPHHNVNKSETSDNKHDQKMTGANLASDSGEPSTKNAQKSKESVDKKSDETDNLKTAPTKKSNADNQGLNGSSKKQTPQLETSPKTDNPAVPVGGKDTIGSKKAGTDPTAANQPKDVSSTHKPESVPKEQSGDVIQQPKGDQSKGPHENKSNPVVKASLGKEQQQKPSSSPPQEPPKVAADTKQKPATVKATDSVNNAKPNKTNEPAVAGDNGAQSSKPSAISATKVGSETKDVKQQKAPAADSKPGKVEAQVKPDKKPQGDVKPSAEKPKQSSVTPKPGDSTTSKTAISPETPPKQPTQVPLADSLHTKSEKAEASPKTVGQQPNDSEKPASTPKPA